MDWLNDVWVAAPWAVIAALILWWVRDRRKDRAAAAVAEGTIAADVAVADIGAADARLLYAVKAFDAERASLQRQIDDCGRELDRKDALIARKDAELEHRDRVIAGLRDQVEELQSRLDDALRQLNSVRQQLVELAEHDTRGGGTADQP